MPPTARRTSAAAAVLSALLLLLGAALSGCASGDDAAADDTSTTAPADDGADDAPDDEAGDEATQADADDVVAPAWEEVAPGGDCMCADGSDYRFWVHEGDPTKVALLLQGGGACFDAETCVVNGGPYKPFLYEEDDPADGDGLLAIDDERNPLAGWSIVWMPYCTGDLHLGRATQEDSPDQVIHHAGAANGQAVLDELGERFPDAEQVFVAGESAGGAAAPLYGGLVADMLPDAEVSVLADGAGAYPDDPAVNTVAGTRWGVEASIPDWEGTEGLGVADWGLPGLFVQAGHHDPDIRFARRDFAHDEVQVFYAQLAGLGDDVLGQINRNEAEIEAQGVDLAAYVSAGEHHTILTLPYLYLHEEAGVPLVDWIADLIAGEPVDDVRCTDCAPT